MKQLVQTDIWKEFITYISSDIRIYTIYHKISDLRCTKSQTKMFLISSTVVFAQSNEAMY